MKKRVLLILNQFVVCQVLVAQSILGIDVSNYQGSINWQQVDASGKVFAFVKATEGFTYDDPSFATNMANGSNAGVVMGAYHFARPDNNTAANEVTHFVNVAGAYIGQGNLPPVLDLEDSPGATPLSTLFSSTALSTWVEAWLDGVYAQTGVAPIVYTNSFYAGYLNSSIVSTNTYKLWIAKIDGSPTTPPTGLGIWSTWLFKQYSWTGTVSGISGSGNVDLNVYNGTTTTFNNLIGGSGGGCIPANDNCASATSITSNGACATGTVACATASGEPQGSCDVFSGTSLLGDVWFSFYPVANATHTISIDPEGSTTGSTAYLDAVVEVYASCNLNPIACEDDNGGGGGLTELTVSNLSTGTPYYIRVYDYGSAAPANGGFEICISHTGGGSEDITVTDASVSPLTVAAGGTVDVQADHNYSGSQLDTDLPTFDLDYYLSTDCSFSGGDEILYSETSSLGSDDPIHSESQTVTIPVGTTPGTYYILFVADADDELSESNENNNVACVQITVTGCSNPSVVTGLSPGNSSASNHEILNQTNPTLSWNSVGGSSVQYAITIWNETTGTWAVFSQCVGNSTQYTPSGLTNGHQYYWFIVAVDGNSGNNCDGSCTSTSSFSYIEIQLCTPANQPFFGLSQPDYDQFRVK